MVIFGYIVVAVWLIVFVFSGGNVGFTVCPSKWIYHIPCPGCGLTRAMMLVFSGRWADAFALNPNVVLPVVLLPTVPLVLLYDLFTHSRSLPAIYNLIESVLRRRYVLIALLAAEAAIWIANIVRGI